MPIISDDGTPGGGSSGILSSAVTITAAQLKALTTVGQELVAAVPGSLIVPLSVTLELLFATTPYAAASSSDIEIVTGADPLAGAGWLALVPAAVSDLVTGAESLVSSFPVLPPTSGEAVLRPVSLAQVFGQPLWIVNYGTELADGDSPVKVTTLYGTVAT